MIERLKREKLIGGTCYAKKRRGAELQNLVITKGKIVSKRV